MTDIDVTREEDGAFEQLARRNDDLEREKRALLDERAEAIQQAVKQARREWAAQASPAVKAQWQAEALEGLITCCKKSPPGKSANDVLRVAEQMARAQRDLMRHQAEDQPHSEEDDV